MGPELALAYANRSAVLGMCSKSLNPHNWFLSRSYEDPKVGCPRKCFFHFRRNTEFFENTRNSAEFRGISR
jgi:hypothetical protein